MRLTAGWNNDRTAKVQPNRESQDLGAFAGNRMRLSGKSFNFSFLFFTKEI